VPEDGVTEVAGIGVRPAFRRRGIAGALTSRLTQEAVACGVTLPFLMAAGEDEARLYAKSGYRLIGDVLHISRPA
jgi:predicted GNAT family acetyltransferase